MSVISVAIQKGGCGKTTTTINLAAAIQRSGKKVLLIDADPQSSLTEALGIVSNNNLSTELAKELRGEDSNLAGIIKEVSSGLHVIPGSRELTGTEMEMVTAYGREQLLTWMMEDLKTVYDFIFIDCPPSAGMLSANALVASNLVIMPLHAEFLPLLGVENFMHQFKTLRKLNRNLQVLGLVLTRYDDRKIMNRQVAYQLGEDYGEKLFRSRIRNSISIANAQQKGMDIFQYDKNSNGAVDYQRLADEFLEKMEKWTQPVQNVEMIPA